MRIVTLILTFLVLSALTVHAGDTPENQTAIASQSGEKSAQSYRLPPEKYQRAVAYARARYALYFISTLYGFLILAAVLYFRFSARLRDYAEKASSRRVVQLLIFAPLLILILTLLGLPLDIYYHQLRLFYDQSVQAWPSWFWDWTKSQLISLGLFTFLSWILYTVIRRSPRSWWFYFWLASLPIIIFVLFITPLVIDPLFFKFQPLKNSHPGLVQQISRVVARGDLTIPEDRMFEMKASEKLKSVNAYVTGFRASKRVVVWDTTLQKMTTSQTLFIFGHEMGHYVLNHVMKTIAFLSILLLAFLYLGFQIMHWSLGRWGTRWGIRDSSDLASLPVLLLFFSICVFLASPLINSYSRHSEHDADIYGLEVIHGIVTESQTAAAESFQILGEINLSDPNPPPLIKLWLYSHPPLNERLKFAAQYDPWSKNYPPKFVK